MEIQVRQQPDGEIPPQSYQWFLEKMENKFLDIPRITARRDRNNQGHLVVTL